MQAMSSTGGYDLFYRKRRMHCLSDISPSNSSIRKDGANEKKQVEYVMGCHGKNITKVRNIKNYLLTSLFNAGSTIGNLYELLKNNNIYANGIFAYILLQMR